MATVKQSQTKQNGQHTDKQMKQSEAHPHARDEVSGAFAGNENEGSSSHPKTHLEHDTAVKSRKTEKSKDRTPEI